MLLMKKIRPIFKALAWLCLAATLPSVAIADTKENRKLPESSNSNGVQCRQGVRPMTESVPLRRGECPKLRRILM
jgi:hypothetical protein